MKKVIGLLLAGILIFSFAGCSNRDKYSDEAITAVESAIMYADRYLDGVIDADEAYDYISNAAYELDDYIENNGGSALTQNFKDSSIFMSLSTLAITFSAESIGGGKIADIKKQVEELKKEIGYK